MKKVLDFYEKIIGWLEIALNLLIVAVTNSRADRGHFGGRISAFPANQDAKNSCGPNSLCVVTHCNYCFYNPVGNFCCAGTAE